MTRVLACITLLFIGVFACGSVGAQELPPDLKGIGIDEKLGDYIPMNLRFVDADGDSVRVGDLITRPTLLTLVYFHCPTICKPFLTAVTDVVGETDLDPGDDYDILTISFDEHDNPQTASTIRSNFLPAVRKDLPDGSWRFLTGDSATIRTLTDAVGFNFKRRENDFAHPTALIVLSPDGKIARYLYGLRYMPFDLKMAVAEASAGKVVPSINRVLRYCFSYDPEGRKYVLNVTRVAGAGILFVFLGWVVYVSSVGRIRKHKAKA